jgi:hypothetical protein
VYRPGWPVRHRRLGSDYLRRERQVEEMMDLLWVAILLAALAGICVNVLSIMEEELEHERED